MGNWLAKFDRRSRLLSEVNSAHYNRRRLCAVAPPRARPSRAGARVLDLGAGDGQIAMALMRLRPDLKVEGVDIVPRARTLIPVTQYDGKTLPFADKSFDYVTIVDVLHHTTDPVRCMLEAAPCCAAGCCDEGPSARRASSLGRRWWFMDWFGNLGDGVPMPYMFLNRREWQGDKLKSFSASNWDTKTDVPLVAVLKSNL